MNAILVACVNMECVLMLMEALGVNVLEGLSWILQVITVLVRFLCLLNIINLFCK